VAKQLFQLVLFCSVAFILPARAWAQDGALASLLVELLQSDVRLAPPAPGFPSHEAHFLPGSQQRLAPYFFNQQVVTQLATFPIGSPSGGFTFTFDAASSTFQRATDSFGPSFAERAFTNGRGRVTVGATFQYSKYSSFEGSDLDDGDIKFYLRHADVGGAFFEGDLVEAALRLDLSSTTTTLFGNYGVTDRLDIAVAVPIVRVAMNAEVDATVLRLATESVPRLHSFPGGAGSATFTRDGSATGLGDVLLRAKYRFVSIAGGGLAAGLDIRLPTGDADNLLGTSAAAATITLIGSNTYGRLAPHFNFGYTGSGSGDVLNVPNEISYKAGTEYAATPRVTLSADLIGRTLLDAGRLELTDTTWNYMGVDGVPGSTAIREYVARDASLTVASLAAGAKVNVTGNLLITGNALVTLTSAGVTARVTPVFGFDYSF
jgi:hypothetical protein